MAQFFVGQRVRIVGATLSTFLIGTETTVVAIDVPAYSTRLGKYTGVATAAMNICGVPFVALPDQLEPITNSNTLVSWESMRDLWVPEHLRVAA